MKTLTEKIPAPLELAKLFHVPQIEVAVRLGVTTSWTRVLARHPAHAARVQIAELEAIVEHLRMKTLLTEAVRSVEKTERGGDL
jgi:hypothetical protein